MLRHNSSRVANPANTLDTQDPLSFVQYGQCESFENLYGAAEFKPYFFKGSFLVSYFC
jgi:hypothetical protein